MMHRLLRIAFIGLIAVLGSFPVMGKNVTYRPDLEETFIWDYDCIGVYEVIDVGEGKNPLVTLKKVEQFNGEKMPQQIRKNRNELTIGMKGGDTIHNGDAVLIKCDQNVQNLHYMLTILTKPLKEDDLFIGAGEIEAIRQKLKLKEANLEDFIGCEANVSTLYVLKQLQANKEFKPSAKAVLALEKVREKPSRGEELRLMANELIIRVSPESGAAWLVSVMKNPLEVDVNGMYKVMDQWLSITADPSERIECLLGLLTDRKAPAASRVAACGKVRVCMGASDLKGEEAKKAISAIENEVNNGFAELRMMAAAQLFEICRSQTATLEAQTQYAQRARDVIGGRLKVEDDPQVKEYMKDYLRYLIRY